MFSQTEEMVVAAVMWLRLGIETLGALIIALGLLVALRRLLGVLMAANDHDFAGVRLALARYLALALEFQLAADILSTAVAPSWQQIGQLAAIAVIRTGLNFFLQREIHGES